MQLDQLIFKIPKHQASVPCHRPATAANATETVARVPPAEFHISKFTSPRVGAMFWG